MAKNYGNFNYGILIKAFHINCTKFYQTFIKFFLEIFTTERSNIVGL